MKRLYSSFQISINKKYDNKNQMNNFITKKYAKYVPNRKINYFILIFAVMSQDCIENLTYCEILKNFIKYN